MYTIVVCARDDKRTGNHTRERTEGRDHMNASTRREHRVSLTSGLSRVQGAEERASDDQSTAILSTISRPSERYLCIMHVRAEDASDEKHKEKL